MGKASAARYLNLPGRIAWLTMESPGFITLLYIMKTLPQKYGIDDLPWQNKVLAGLYVSQGYVNPFFLCLAALVAAEGN